MRIPSQTEYRTAKAALAVYSDFCKPYVQRNGWTVIPADAPRPRFEGAELSAEMVNAYSTTVELFEINRDKPAKLTAYVTSGAPNGKGDWRITTWTGEVLSSDLIAGSPYRNPRRSYTSDTITPIRAKICGNWYAGRALGAGIYVNLRRVKGQ